MRTHPCRQPSYTKKRQVLAEEEEEEGLVWRLATGELSNFTYLIYHHRDVVVFGARL